MANSRIEKGREVEEEEKEKEEEGRAQKSEMQEWQRAHHKSVFDANEERPKEEGRRKGQRTPLSKSSFGEVWKVALSLCNCGTELAKRERGREGRRQ